MHHVLDSKPRAYLLGFAILIFAASLAGNRAKAEAPAAGEVDRGQVILQFLTTSEPDGPGLSEAKATALLENCWHLKPLETVRQLEAQYSQDFDSLSNQREQANQDLRGAARNNDLNQLKLIGNRTTDLALRQQKIYEKQVAVRKELQAREAGEEPQSAERQLASLQRAWQLYRQWLREPSGEMVARYRADAVSNERSVHLNRGISDSGDIYGMARLHFRQPDKGAQVEAFFTHTLADRRLLNAAVELIDEAWKAERSLLDFRHDHLHRLVEVRWDHGHVIDNRHRPHHGFWCEELKTLRGWLPEFRQRHGAWHQVYRKYSPRAWLTPFSRPIRDLNAARLHDAGVRKICQVQLPNCTWQAYKAWSDSMRQQVWRVKGQQKYQLNEGAYRVAPLGEPRPQK